MSRSGVPITCRICSRVIPGAKVESRDAAGLVAAIGCGAAAATGAAAGEAVIAGEAGGAGNAAGRNQCDENRVRAHGNGGYVVAFAGGHFVILVSAKQLVLNSVDGAGGRLRVQKRAEKAWALDHHDCAGAADVGFSTNAH